MGGFSAGAVLGITAQITQNPLALAALAGAGAFGGGMLGKIATPNP
jgi:hypothetical protein